MPLCSPSAWSNRRLSLLYPVSFVFCARISGIEDYSSMDPAVSSLNKLSADLSFYLSIFFALASTRVIVSMETWILRSVFKVMFWFLPIITSTFVCFLLNKKPCSKSHSMLEHQIPNLSVQHVFPSACSNAWIWKQTDRRRWHILQSITWLLSSSLLMICLSPTICIDGESVSPYLLVFPSPRSSSTSPVGGPILGSWNRGLGSDLSGGASSIRRHYLPTKGAGAWPLEHGVELYSWLWWRLVSPIPEATSLPTAAFRRWRRLQNFAGGKFCEGRRRGPVEDAWTALTAVVAVRVQDVDAWMAPSLGSHHVYYRALVVILIFFLVQIVTRAVLCCGDPSPLP